VQVKMDFNPAFKPVHNSKKRYVIMKGSAGSGKSVDTAQSYVLRLLTQPGRNLLCIRKSEVTNRDSTFAELVGAINRNNLSAYFKTTMNPLQIACKVNGNTVIFRGMNDERQREKIKSITFPNGKLTDVWLEEMTELTKNDFEIIDDRLRGDLQDGLFYQIKGTFNPVSKEHWIKKDFFDYISEDVLTHHSTYLNNRFIDAAYHRRMMRRKELDPDGYRIYGLGDWGELGGLILKNYVIEDFNRDPMYFDQMVNAQDFGFNHANCIGEVGFKDGELYLCREIYVHELDTDEIIQLANEHKIQKRIIMYCDSAEPDRIKMWKKAGYKARGVKKEPGSVMAQIDCLKKMKIHIHPSCVNTIKEIQQWKWKKDERLNIYLDEPVNIFDDAMAMLRYSVEEYRRSTGGRSKSPFLT